MSRCHRRPCMRRRADRSSAISFRYSRRTSPLACALRCIHVAQMVALNSQRKELTPSLFRSVLCACRDTTVRSEQADGKRWVDAMCSSRCCFLCDRLSPSPQARSSHTSVDALPLIEASVRPDSALTHSLCCSHSCLLLDRVKPERARHSRFVAHTLAAVRTSFTLH